MGLVLTITLFSLYFLFTSVSRNVITITSLVIDTAIVGEMSDLSLEDSAYALTTSHLTLKYLRVFVWLPGRARAC